MREVGALVESLRVKLAPSETLLLNELVPEASATPSTTRNPWLWVPTLYFAEGLPNAIVTTISIVLYKALGVSNTRIGVYTAWFYLPWVIKPLWSPVVDILKTRRVWIWRMQCILGLLFAGIAFALPGAHFIAVSLVLFWLVALTSATHDIAMTGFYGATGEQWDFSERGNTQNLERLFGVRENWRHEHKPKTYLRRGKLRAQIGRPFLQAGFIEIARPMVGNGELCAHNDKLTSVRANAKGKVVVRG